MSQAEKIGIDIGKSSCKFAWRHGIREIPSYMSRGKLTQMINDPLSRPCMISYGGSDWILGEDAVLGKSFTWRTDEEKGDNRSLLFIMMILSRLGVAEADIVIGLPVSTAVNNRKVQMIKNALSGEKTAEINGKLQKFSIKTKILAEPIGTYFSLVLDDQCRPLKMSPFFQDQMVVIDIGYRTVDIVTLQGGKLAEIKNSTMSGMVNLFEQIWKDIESEHGLLQWREKVKIHDDIIHNFRTALLKANGQIIDPRIWDRISQYKVQLAADISDEIKSILSSIRPDRMLVTGGGSIPLKDDLLDNIPQLSFHLNPRYANAIGFYRAAQISSASAE